MPSLPPAEGCGSKTRAPPPAEGRRRLAEVKSHIPSDDRICFAPGLPGVPWSAGCGLARFPDRAFPQREIEVPFALAFHAYFVRFPGRVAPNVNVP